MKSLQHAHNAVARALRSEDLARETLEVVSYEIIQLRRTGVLRNEEAEHNQIFRRVLSQSLKPSKHSPGRILASTPIRDPTLKSGISSRLLRVRILREADVIEFKIGDIVVDAKSPLPQGGMLILGNGVLEIRTVNDEPGDEPLVIGCKSSR